MIPTLHSIPLFADSQFEISDLIVVLFFLGFAFINWVISKIKAWLTNAQRQSEAQNSPKEEELRRKIWELQTGQSSEQNSTPPPLPNAPEPHPREIRDLKDLVEVVKDAIAPAPEVTPTPPRQPRRFEANKEVLREPRVSPPIPQVDQPVIPTYQRARLEKTPVHPSYRDENYKPKEIHPLAKLLHDPKGYRQAVILKEILDTPKALRFDSRTQD